MFNYPAYNNGIYCKLEDLNISILDFGFIHSDATYDVLSVKDGNIEDLNLHLNRFENSCKSWRLNPPYKEKLIEILNQLVNISPTKDLLLWICVTRGIPSSGNPRDLQSCTNRFYAYVKPYYGFNESNEATVLLAKQRRNTSFNQSMKNFAWNDLNLAQWEAIDLGYDTSILLDEKGYVTEGPGFNIGIILGNNIYTPIQNCLNGVTMMNVENLCKNKYAFHRINIPKYIIESADAMFLTSTAGKIIKVTQFNDTIYEENEVLQWILKNI